MNKQNVWDEVEAKLRKYFPYPYPETDYRGNPLKEEEKEDYYDSSSDPVISFLSQQPGIRLFTHDGVIESVEFEESFYAKLSYDEIPQDTEDEVVAVIKIEDKFFKVGLYYTSYSGYLLSGWAHEVSPKTIEVVVYE